MQHNLFNVELNKPKYVLPLGSGHDLMTIFSSCFEFPCDNFFIVWNNITISCSYKYELPYLIYPLLEITDRLSTQEEGNYKTFMGSDSLQAEWSLQWENGNLLIKSVWLQAPNGSKDSLNKQNVIKISVIQFLIEWVKLFEFIKDILIRSEISLEDWYYNRVYFDKIIHNINERILMNK